MDPRREVRQFWAKVKKTPMCWLWQGAKQSAGYGVFKRELAHRYSYKRYKGEIPAGLQIRHSCDTPLCVRPAHLSVGTHVDNALDSRSRGRMRNGRKERTHCPQGHAYTGENIYRTTTKAGKPGRQCRACKNERSRAWNEAQRGSP